MEKGHSQELNHVSSTSEHVLFLIPAVAFGRVHAHVDFAVFVVHVAAVPGRDAVSPPDLAADAPVLNVLHPVEIGLGPAVGIELDRAGADCLDGGLGELVHADEPLVAEERFDLHAAALGEADVVDDVLDFFEEAELFHLRHALLAAFVAVEPGVLAALGVHGAVAVHDVDEFEVVTFADLIVVRVMGGRDLHAAGALFRVGVLVLDDRDPAVGERQVHGLADEVLVARIAGRDRHGGVAEHGFGTRGGDDEITGAVGERVAEMPELALHFAVDDFLVGKRALGGGAPVHHALAAVDVAFFIELDEHLADGGAEALVHGEAFAVPVAGRAELAELLDDRAAVELLPFPDAFDELLAAERAAVDAFLLAEDLVDLALGGDAGVVGAGEPADFLAHHAVPADEDVLQRVVQDVPHGEDAGHVRRRDDDGIGLLVGIRFAVEAFVGLPLGVPFLFDFSGQICFRHFRHDDGLLSSIVDSKTKVKT